MESILCNLDILKTDNLLLSDEDVAHLLVHSSEPADEFQELPDLIEYETELSQWSSVEFKAQNDIPQSILADEILPIDEILPTIVEETSLDFNEAISVNNYYLPENTTNGKSSLEPPNNFTSDNEIFFVTDGDETEASGNTTYDNKKLLELRKASVNLSESTGQKHEVKTNRVSKRRLVNKESSDYKLKRERNNVSVKKSRIKSRLRHQETETKVKLLAEENQQLKTKIDVLNKELNILKGLFRNVGILCNQGMTQIQEDI